MFEYAWLYFKLSSAQAKQYLSGAVFCGRWGITPCRQSCHFEYEKIRVGHSKIHVCDAASKLSCCYGQCITPRIVFPIANKGMEK